MGCMQTEHFVEWYTDKMMKNISSKIFFSLYIHHHHLQHYFCVEFATYSINTFKTFFQTQQKSVIRVNQTKVVSHRVTKGSPAVVMGVLAFTWCSNGRSGDHPV